MSAKVELVGMSEIARMLGVERNTLNQWRFRGHMPPPYSELQLGPVWERKTIEEWWKEFRQN